MESRLVAD